jgi:excinuclease ABC subunit C
VAPVDEVRPLEQAVGRTLKVLKASLRESCPKVPGVYAMLDLAGQVLYIGKSKTLRNRLLSYFHPQPEDGKVKRLMAQTTTIVWERLPNEFAALLRELQLIRRFRPRYNVQGQPGRLRRSFLCIGRAPAPYVYLSPKPTARVIDCFGPLLGAWRAAEAARHLNDLFQLRDCADRKSLRFSNQKDLFPIDRSAGCLRFDIGTCLGPCMGATSRATYGRRLKAVRAFLSGEDRSLLDRLAAEMQSAAETRNYERAAKLRDQYTILSGLRENLDWIDEARRKFAFVYPMTDHQGQPLWSVIRGGQVEATVRVPHDIKSGRRTAKQIQKIFDRPAVHSDPLLLEAFDMVLLVSRWFRQHPEELDGVLTAEEALSRCADPARFRAADDQALLLGEKVARSAG